MGVEPSGTPAGRPVRDGGRVRTEPSSTDGARSATNAGEREGNAEAGVFVRLSSAPGATIVASTRVDVRARACFQNLSFSLSFSLSLPLCLPSLEIGRAREKRADRQKKESGRNADARVQFYGVAYGFSGTLFI